LFSGLVYCHSVGGVVFALWTVCVDFFWKLRFPFTHGRERFGALGVLLFITLRARF
jgi:hypothetical protein